MSNTSTLILQQFWPLVDVQYVIVGHGIHISACLINCHRQLLPIHVTFLLDWKIVFWEIYIDLTHIH